MMPSNVISIPVLWSFYRRLDSVPRHPDARQPLPDSGPFHPDSRQRLHWSRHRHPGARHVLHWSRPPRPECRQPLHWSHPPLPDHKPSLPGANLRSLLQTFVLTERLIPFSSLRRGEGEVSCQADACAKPVPPLLFGEGGQGVRPPPARRHTGRNARPATWRYEVDSIPY